MKKLMIGVLAAAQLAMFSASSASLAQPQPQQRAKKVCCEVSRSYTGATYRWIYDHACRAVAGSVVHKSKCGR